MNHQIILNRTITNSSLVSMFSKDIIKRDFTIDMSVAAAIEDALRAQSKHIDTVITIVYSHDLDRPKAQTEEDVQGRCKTIFVIEVSSLPKTKIEIQVSIKKNGKPGERNISVYNFNGRKKIASREKVDIVALNDTVVKMIWNSFKKILEKKEA